VRRKTRPQAGPRPSATLTVRMTAELYRQLQQLADFPPDGSEPCSLNMLVVDLFEGFINQRR
jgi:hypothetical protein